MLLLAISLEQLAELAQVVAACATVLALLGLVFVWKQVKLQQDNSRVEVVTGLTTLITDVDRVFIDHPALWKYFNDDVPVPERGDEEGDRVRVIAVTMANVLDHIVEHRQQVTCETKESWLRYVTEVHEKSPAFREVLEVHRTWWPGLQRQIREGAGEAVST